MNTLLLSYFDNLGGAARAAYRLHRALLNHGESSRMKVRIKNSDDWTIEGPVGRTAKALGEMRPKLGNLMMRMQRTTNVNLHTGNFIPSRWAKEINSSSVDVVNLHWVANETLSIEDIGRINKPVVWTLHDMWAFSGAEHLTEYGEDARWRTGYGKNNREAGACGLDINRLVWLRKLKSWQTPIHIVAPSNWLANCARQSDLMRDWPISVVPNVLDTKVYKPLEKSFCRHVLDLPQNRKIILFGAMFGSKNPNKGWDLLLSALHKFEQLKEVSDITCVIFGQSEPPRPPDLPFPVRWMGPVHDDPTLVLLYNAADIMIVPSRQENLPQAATEAHACGCPVVAFDCSGLPDVVFHRQTGYLARPYEVEDLAQGILWVLEDESRRRQLGESARKRALAMWRSELVVSQYLDIYQSAIQTKRKLTI